MHDNQTHHPPTHHPSITETRTKPNTHIPAHTPTNPHKPQRAQYSRDVVDGKVSPDPDTPIMTKRELKRVVAANKAVKEKGFRAD